jgi:hypothetical protein
MDRVFPVRPADFGAERRIGAAMAGIGAMLRAATAAYSAKEPSRYQSVRPNTRCPKESPVVP